MKIRLVPKKNPQKREEVKFYANPVNVGRKTLDDIARDISGRSSLTRGDISNVLYNFIDCLPHYLRDGFSIQLGEFGSMRVTLSSKGAETEKAFKTETIKPRVVFTPGTELKRELAANSYESLRKKEEEEEEDPDASIWVKGWNWLVKKAKGIWHVVNYPFSVVADYISTITKLFIIAAGASYLAVVTFFTVMTSKIFAFASLTMGPLFVFFAAFEKPRSWFSSWLSSTIGYLFTFVTVMLVWGFLLNVFKDMFYVNAENPLTWGATFKCLFACLFFGKIMDKVGDLASNWFGTSNVTGGGQFINL